MTSKSLKFFKFEFDVHDYVPEIYTSANFHFTHSGGFSPDRWNITVLWLFSWLLIILYFPGHAPRSNPRGWIFTVYGSYDVFSPTDGPFGGCDNIGIPLGNSPKNSPKRGVNGQFQAKRAEYENRGILQSINTINVQF